MACNNAVGKTWDPTPRAMRWVYTSIIRLKISYESIVWSRRTQNYLKNWNVSNGLV
ncbi:uncharacterized protein LOC108253832 [Caligus rogercresseyi]|uniref:Uncharacterized protein LOC108253832 n=1 Tax=Caligus rogercresseyi TaxID=217165 RepID=A0A7T8K9T8_CALRO|nr:uncharacterized protein LOC108253832 [Caligus rogercresseyi]